MEKNKLIAMIIGVALTVAGSIFGYNFKGDVCGNPDAPKVESQGK